MTGTSAVPAQTIIYTGSSGSGGALNLSEDGMAQGGEVEFAAFVAEFTHFPGGGHGREKAESAVPGSDGGTPLPDEADSADMGMRAKARKTLAANDFTAGLVPASAAAPLPEAVENDAPPAEENPPSPPDTEEMDGVPPALTEAGAAPHRLQPPPVFERQPHAVLQDDAANTNEALSKAEEPASSSPADKSVNPGNASHAELDEENPATRDKGAEENVPCDAVGVLPPVPQTTAQQSPGQKPQEVAQGTAPVPGVTPEVRSQTQELAQSEGDTKPGFEAAEASADKSEAPASGSQPPLPRSNPLPETGAALASSRKRPPPAGESRQPNPSSKNSVTEDAFTVRPASDGPETAPPGSISPEDGSRNEPRDHATMTEVKLTIVRQETYFAPAMQRSPAGQMAEQILSDLAPTVPQSDSAPVQNAPPAGQMVKLLQIRLDPPELGPLTVRMTLKQETLTLQVEAGKHETAALIEKDREAIHGLLRSAGYRVDGLTVQIATPDKPAMPSSFTGAGSFQQPPGHAASGGHYQEQGHEQSWRGDGHGETFRGNGNEAPDARGGSRTAGGAVYL